MNINIKPYGTILKDRFDLAVRYKLLKEFHGLWLTTKKCQKNYKNFGEYLQGKIEKPKKIIHEKSRPLTREEEIKELSLL